MPIQAGMSNRGIAVRVVDRLIAVTKMDAAFVFLVLLRIMQINILGWSCAPSSLLINHSVGVPTEMKSIPHITCFAFTLLLTTSSSKLAIAQSRQLAETAVVKSGDTQLYLELRGPAEQKPVLLYLHGGPGQALGLVAFRSYVGPNLESRFLVCYLHQRGVINSPMVPDASLTVANHVADVHNVIQYLQTRFPGRKIYLLGHSWGGTLALLSLLDYQGPVAGVIDVSGPMNFPATVAASYQATLKWAEDTGNKEAIQELKELGPPPYHDFMQQFGLGKWSSAVQGGIAQHLSPATLLGRAPFTTMEPSWQDAQLRIAKAMYGQLFEINIDSRLGSLKTPLLMISAKLDAIVPSAQLQESYRLYGGPKQWVELSASNHLSFVDEPEAFVKAVSDFVR
jgi:proline iminopeptidase